MEKTKIDWADSTFNPVTGCLHGCKYCYAKAIATRFDGGWRCDYLPYPVLDEPFRSGGKMQPYPYGFLPTFHRYRLDEYREKKGRNIFVCSMADLFGEWVPDEWLQEVFTACKEAPQHNYMFLTKNPDRYIRLTKEDKLPRLDNFWYGSSVTKKSDKYAWFDGLLNFNWFLSIEPLLEDLGQMNSEADKPGWVIIGAETGRRKGKVTPERGWVESIVNQCKQYEIPMFMKQSLETVWGGNLIQEYPAGLRRGRDGK